MLAYWAGFRVGLGLILAIGAQNAFVLRQGIRREWVFVTCLFCAASDALLISLGVGGFGVLTARLPWLEPVLLWGGIAFLLVYGARAALAAWRGGEVLEPGQGAGRLAAILGALALITFANPHVWLDTVVLLGAVSAQYGAARWSFAAGAMTGSVVFFFALGYGARLLAPLFARPMAWRVLDGLVALVMWSVALSLLHRAGF